MDAKKRAEVLQKRWAADAFRDEKYLRNRARLVRSPILQKTYTHEANVAHYWGERRLRALKKGRLV